LGCHIYSGKARKYKKGTFIIFMVRAGFKALKLLGPSDLPLCFCGILGNSLDIWGWWKHLIEHN